MFDVNSQLAVQSYCYRNFKPIDALIGQIKALGLSRTELCAVHIDFANEALFESTIAQFKAANIQIASIGVQYFKGDPAVEEKWFKFAKAAGCKMISASFFIDGTPNSIRMVEKFADKYDLLVGIHNHGGYDWLGNGTILEHTFKNSSERIGLCIDTAWCLQARQDPVKWADQFKNRLFGAHIKDFVFHKDGKPEDVIVGTGNLKLKEFLNLLTNSPKGATAITLEYEGDVDNPNPKLKECVQKIKEAVA
jgi:sugar phosphate isomerase/epimerase